jgi:hypothetical protein
LVKIVPWEDDKDRMHTIKRYWPYILVAIIAAGIPLSALFLEPAAKTAASASDERFESGVLRKTDTLGYAWALQRAGGRSVLSFRTPGSPIKVKTSVRRVGSGAMSIGLVLEGQAGETYRPTVTKNRAALPAPWVRIVDERDNVIGEGRFEYG